MQEIQPDPHRVPAGTPGTAPAAGEVGIVRPVVVTTSGPRPNGIATASLTLAIVGIAVGIIPLFIGLILSFVPTVLAIVFALIGIARAPSRESGYPSAVAGLLIGCLTVVLWFNGYGIWW